MNIISKVALGAVGCIAAMTSVSPFYAASIGPHRLEIGSDVEPVQYTKKRPQRWDRHDNRRGDNWRAERRDWNGHRGYRDRRAGYRRNSAGF